MLAALVHDAAVTYCRAAGISHRALSLRLTSSTNLIARLDSGQVTAATLQAVCDHLLAHPVEGFEPPDWLLRQADARGTAPSSDAAA